MDSVSPVPKQLVLPPLSRPLPPTIAAPLAPDQLWMRLATPQRQAVIQLLSHMCQQLVERDHAEAQHEHD
mgnify:CR=1 FL=1